MHEADPLDRLRVDQGRMVDWSRTSTDYAAHRPGYPDSFYARLADWGLGRPGQRVLDLGTGTGTLARALAARGCQVVGVDASPGQIEAARQLAEQERLPVEFLVAPAEETGLTDGQFDLITASQCWLYFDKPRVTAEVFRLLAPGGRLLTCHLSWLPLPGSVAEASEALVLRYNPQWTGGGWPGQVPIEPLWPHPEHRLRPRAMFYFDAPLEFTSEGWRGRMRACRGIGAALSDEEVAQFDAELAQLLAEHTSTNLVVWHRIDAHLFEPVGGTAK